MSWLQAHLTIDKEKAPLIELLFENLGAFSITLGDAGDEPLLEPAPGVSPLWRSTRVSGLFSADTDCDHLRSAIDQALNRDVSRHLEMETLEDQAWERAWLDNFHPMRFGRRLWICPAGQRPERQDGLFIDLDPGLAFGTGTHPTTALCLQWLDGAEIKDSVVMDFGCGSGILAIAALKLGARQVTAVDHDPQALQATHDNAAKNSVLRQLRIQDTETVPDDQVDLLLANILAGTLIELEPKLADHTRPGGKIILSGILSEQAVQVINAFTPHFEMRPPERQEEWVLIEGRRR